MSELKRMIIIIFNNTHTLIFKIRHGNCYHFLGFALFCCLTGQRPHCLMSLSLSQEQEFLQKQQQELDSALKKIIQQHKLELATVERDCLSHKQQLLRGEAHCY